MADQEFRRIIHDLRGHLSTIQLSALVLETEGDLTETGKMSVKRIANALYHSEQVVEQLEHTTCAFADAPSEKPGGDPI